MAVFAARKEEADHKTFTFTNPMAVEYDFTGTRAERRRRWRKVWSEREWI